MGPTIIIKKIEKIYPDYIKYKHTFKNNTVIYYTQ
jgi:hypothetical protein